MSEKTVLREKAEKPEKHLIAVPRQLDERRWWEMQLGVPLVRLYTEHRSGR